MNKNELPATVADSTGLSVDELREKLFKSEQARAALERLNEFSRALNAAEDLEQVLDQVFEYITHTFGIEVVWLLLVDKQRGELHTSRTPPGIENRLSPETVQYVREFRVPLRYAGSFTHTYRKKRRLYFPRLRDSLLAGLDAKLKEMLGISALLQIPLMIRDEVIGIVCFTNHSKPLTLSRRDITALENFGDEIAGAVHRSHLFERIAAEKEKSDKLRLEIQTLNDFSRRINASTNLDEILDRIFTYIETTFNFEAIILGLPDAAGEFVEFNRYTSPQHFSPEQLEYLRTFRVAADSDSVMALAYRRKRPLYLRRFLSVQSSVDQEFVAVTGITSTLMVPLVIKDEPVGILFCNRWHGLNLSRVEIQAVARFAEQVAGAIHGASLLRQVQKEREKSDELLLNILPAPVASEIKENGKAEPVVHDSVTVMFTDFVGFTSIAETLSPGDLIRELDGCFTQFDEIAVRHRLEKLKTIGDAYMCAGGLPRSNGTHALDACLAALEFQAFMDRMREIKASMNLSYWELRIGIHTGPVTAGVVGKFKFAYDIWGDTVNIASRCESAGSPGRVNISAATHDLVSAFLECEYRGKVRAKGKGEIDMYYVNRIRPEFARDEEGRVPNAKLLNHE